MDKQAKLKSIILFLALIGIFSIFLVNATTTQDIPVSTDVTLAYPADNSYFMNSTIQFIVNATGVVDWNITQVILKTNVNGTWGNSSIVRTAGLKNNTAYGYVFNLSNVSDGTVITWNVLVNYSNVSTGASNGLHIYASENYTVTVEYPPIVNLHYPVDSSWSNATTQFINYSVVNDGNGINRIFDCKLFTNESGAWAQQRSLGTATNSTYSTFNYEFEELSAIKWNIDCAETTNANIHDSAASNLSIKIDRTTPVISNIRVENGSVVNNTYFKKKDIYFNYTITDLYSSGCILYINRTINISDTLDSPDGNFTTGITDGVYTFGIRCNDSSGNYVNSTEYWFNIDTVYPTYGGINYGNGSVRYTADDLLINFTASELVNATVHYGTLSQTNLEKSNSSKVLITNLTLNNLKDNTFYFFNLTICDVAGNCNKSADSLKQMNFTFPSKVLTGWNYFGVYDARINFSRILNESDAEFVYYWNQTGQTWVYASAGGTSNAGFQVGSGVTNEISGGGRHTILLYESTNSTWKRNISTLTTNNVEVTPSSYFYNFTSGHNFVKLYKNYTMYDLALSLRNDTSDASGCFSPDFGMDVCKTPAATSGGGLNYNFSKFHFSVYNQSAGTWTVNYIYNWTYNNNTNVGNTSAVEPLSGFEVAWIWSPANLSWNTTGIYANWSRR